MRYLFAALALSVPSVAVAADAILVHRDPGCGCCGEWAKIVKAQFGRTVRIVDDANRPAMMKARGVPADLASCHTAIIDGMTFEGHVPIADMKGALAQRPKGVSGLAVAGMPLGSPGMDMPGRAAQSFEVVAFGPNGRRVFARH
ncbi:DUF411 domain-containing protein [Sphingomonas aliaeris]|uniref:DUF411 domain-containing protein n=1 Tax=Sphingomonas aliaeris TaxID=2759526 RepID=A0A974S5V1_9SPHN|nr:DUF411 domain-containing protein [Sphingomonas aliaeris]QQV78742.1 DUF411 domain-containing protein [Sphingomonas aliaeris]QQV78821.1 DUF411 domain-containing protein [Sphingomonas aliaeris]